MKKIIFILGFFISLTICTSCSNDEAITTNTTNEIEGSYNQGFNTLKEDIYEYNVNTFHPTRNIWGFFKKLWKKVAVVTADALGGTVGAVFGGGVPGALAGAGIASGTAGAIINKSINVKIKLSTNPSDINTDFNRCAVPTSIVFPDTTAFNGINLNKDVIKGEPDGPKFNVTMNEDSIGYHHNKVLFTIFNDSTKREYFNSLSSLQQANYIIKELRNDNYLSTFTNKLKYNNDSIMKITGLVDYIFKTAEKAETEDEFFDNLASNPNIDNNIVDILREVVNGLMQIDPKEDDGKYAQQVTEYIDNSNIPDFAKRQLHYSVVIANASNHL